MVIARSIKQTLIENSMPEPNTGCWLWFGATNKDGYGAVRRTTAHRAAYETWVGRMRFKRKCVAAHTGTEVRVVR